MNLLPRILAFSNQGLLPNLGSALLEIPLLLHKPAGSETPVGDTAETEPYVSPGQQLVDVLLVLPTVFQQHKPELLIPTLPVEVAAVVMPQETETEGDGLFDSLM